MLLTLIAAGTGVLNQLFKARTARILIKRNKPDRSDWVATLTYSSDAT